MSGGVDSAVAAQLALDARRRGRRRHARAVGRPRTSTATRSCCSPQAVAGARALAHRMGIPHFTLDLREPFREHGRGATSSPSTSAGRTPNPCVRCNGIVRFDAMLELADRLGAARLATGPLRAHRARRRRPAARRRRATPPRTRPTCSPALAAGPARAALVPARRADEARGAGARRAAPACRWPTSPRARTSASSPASGGKEASCAATRATWSRRRRRHRGHGRPRARPPRRPAPLHGRPAPRPRASRRTEPLYVIDKDAAQRPRDGGAAAARCASTA